MAFDGIITKGIVKEMQDKILYGKIEKVYQPEKDELVFNIHTKTGNQKLFASANSSASRIHFVKKTPSNPPTPLSFCMLLRKHLQGGRITQISQFNSDRIIEISLESLNELGFTVSKKLIFEIMGKHSNIILVDLTTNKIIDSIKRVSIDVNRVRQLLPGKIYEYPPKQDKIGFEIIDDTIANELEDKPKIIMSKIGGISPAIADELALRSDKFAYISNIINNINNSEIIPTVYLDNKNTPKEFHLTPLSIFETSCEKKEFEQLSEAIEYFFDNRKSSNRIHQKSHDLVKSTENAIDKLSLKKQRLLNDLLKAENSEDFRLFGELITANIHLIKNGDTSIEVINYYDGEPVIIPLDARFTPAKNAQIYFKKYGKSKTAIKEKHVQLEETNIELEYLDSVLTNLINANSEDDIEIIRNELVEAGIIKKRKTNIKEKRFKSNPFKYTTSDKIDILVGRNNKENDILTFKTAENRDYWFHTKDIPGSHTILLSKGCELSEEAIFETAAIAAYHSKARDSENVPVDYVQVKYVKKPAGAKPGMVIFTNNKTVWVNPSLPKDSIDVE